MDIHGFEIMVDAAGNGYQVPRTEVKNWEVRGFRILKPEPGYTTVDVEVATVSEPVVVEAKPTDPNLVDVNSATEKELIALPEIGLAIARKVIANRPYSNVQDLITKVPLKDKSIWVALEGRLTYGPIS